MALWGTVKTLRAQLVAREKFTVALDYLEKAFTPGTAEHRRIMAMPAGGMERVDLAEGVFALEQAYHAKPRSAGRFEAHDRHIDLQAILAGPERMDVAARDRLQINEDGLADRDVCFLDDAEGVSSWVVQAGEVAVFFPTDAHMPSLAAGEPVVVQKTCVKVTV